MHPMYAPAHGHVHREMKMCMNFPAALPRQLHRLLSDAFAAWVPTLLLERQPAKGIFSAEIGKAKGRKLCPLVLHPTGAGEELQGRQSTGWC